MTLDRLVLTPETLSYLVNLAVAATLPCGASLLAAWACRRCSVPLRHGILVSGLVLVLLCPAAAWLGQKSDLALVRWTIAAPGNPEAVESRGRSPSSALTEDPADVWPFSETAATSPIVPPRPVPLGDSSGPVPAEPGTAPSASGPAAGSGLKAALAANGDSTQGTPRSLSRAAWWQVAGSLVAYAWAIGILVGSLRLGWGCMWAGRLRRGLAESPAPRLKRIACKAAEVLRLPAPPPVLVCRSAPVPLSIGLLRPAIVLPEATAEELNDDQLAGVLLHEAAHVAHHDQWVGLVQRIAAVAFWWNPVVHWVSGRISELREDICDNYVVRVQGGGDRFARTLIDIVDRVAFPPRLPAAVGILPPKLNGLSGRIARLLNRERNMETRMNLASRVAVVSCGLAVLSCLALVAGVQISYAEQTASSEAAETAAPDAEQDLAAAETQTPDVPQTRQRDSRPAEAAKTGEEKPGDGFDFRGQVVDPEGKPVQGARIYLLYITPVELPPPEVRAVTDADGKFRFTATESDFRHGHVSPPWMMSAIFAVTDGYGLNWQPAAGFDVSGKFMESLESSGFGGRLLARVPKALLQIYMKNTIKLVRDDVPLDGRIVDPDGRPVAGATVRVVQISASEEEDLTAWLNAVEKEKADYYKARIHVKNSTPDLHPMLKHLLPAAASDADGRFRVEGVGRERIAKLLIEGPGIETGEVLARTRPGPPLKVPRQKAEPRFGTFTFYGASFEHAARRSVPIVGTIRDMDNGKPLAGVTIQSYTLQGHPISGLGRGFIRTKTDEQGRYRLTGIPVGKDNVILAVPPVDQPYLVLRKSAELPADKDSVEIDFRLKRGVWIRGRVTDAATGEPVRAEVEYFFRLEGQREKRIPGFARLNTLYRTDEEGRYAIPGLPGRGIVGVHAYEHERYPRAAGAEAIEGGDRSHGGLSFRTDPSICNPRNFHAVAEVNPAEDAESVEQDFVLDPARTLTGTVLDPDGQPLTGAEFSGLTEFSGWRPLDSATFTVQGYRPDKPRTLQVIHKGRKLAGGRVLEGPQQGPLTARLEPWGAIRARVVDEDGKPKPGQTLIPWYRYSLYEPGNGLLPERHYQTDNQGRFHIEGLIPGMRYNIAARDEKGMLAGQVVFDVTVEPGQTKDLGDLPIKQLAVRQKLEAEKKQASADAR